MILQKTNISYNKINSDLYLGSWCIDLIENISKNKIHKYHWSNLEKFDEDSKLIFKYYDFFIMELTSILNLNNNENKNYKYWQRIIGPWLLYFISVVFDRYENLKSLKNKSEIITYIPKYDKNDWVPLDFIDFEDMISRDDWNLYIYSEIIKITNIINYKILENNLVNKKKYRRKKDTLLKKISKNLIHYFIKFIPEKYRDVCLIETNMSILNIFWINIKLKKFPIQYYVRENTKIKKINYNLRNKYSTQMKSKNYNDEFIKLLTSLVFKNIPIAYLESFNTNKDRSSKIYPSNPKFILTSSAYFSNEMFKIWSAEKSEENKKIFIQVHGGHHASASFNHPGKLTEILADKFFTWGWTKNVLSSPKLSRLKINSKKFICNEQKFKICFIVYNSNKYSTSITSSPTSSNFLSYLNNNREIILKLKNHILENLTIRIKESSHSWNIENYYRQLGVNNFSYLNKLNFNVTNDLKKLVSTNSLFICHYDSTMFYELLTLNIPTIFFCDEKFWKLSKKCKNDFNILKKVNIYFNSINELIHFLNNSNKNKINQWWFKKETQNVKNDFLKIYGLSNKGYLDEWTNIITTNYN